MKYFITEEQFEELEQLSSKICKKQSELRDICDSEKPDIRIGFMIGQIHNEILEMFFNTDKLVENIRTQSILEENKNEQI